MNYIKSLYSSSPSISIKLDKNKHNFFQYITNTHTFLFPTYFDNDKITGTIELKLNSNKSIIIQSLSIYLIGILQNQISNIYEKIYEDIVIISPKGTPQIIINEINNFDFEFEPRRKPYESFIGHSNQIKYFLNVVAETLIDGNASKIENKMEICCLKPASKKICDEIFLNKDINKPLNVNIGVENVIHININLLKTKYCLDDVIEGKIKIVKSKLKLNSINLEIKREEKINVGEKILADCQDLAKYELVEGYPEQEDEIYFRYYLNGVKNLTPSYKLSNNDNKDKGKGLEVRYFLSFEFNDNEGYQFFKNIEIEIIRMNLNNLFLKNENKDKKEEENNNKIISIKKSFKK